MKASSESGLWATVISLSAAETDEDGISKSYNTLLFSAGGKGDSLRKNSFYPGSGAVRKIGFFLYLLRRLLFRSDFQRWSRRRQVRAAQVPAQPPQQGSRRHHNGYNRKRQQYKQILHQRWG